LDIKRMNINIIIDKGEKTGGNNPLKKPAITPKRKRI
jgi:hypothetical protein